MNSPNTKQSSRGSAATPAQESAPSLQDQSLSSQAMPDKDATLRAMSPSPRTDMLEVKPKPAAHTPAQRLPDGRTVTEDLDPHTLPTQKLGAKGEWVKYLQSKLNDAGASLKVDGDFGRKTHDAVKRFQADEKIAKTGVVDGATWRELLETPSSTSTRQTVISQPAPTTAQDIATNPEMRDLLKLHEDVRLKRYKCSAGHWTIGVGHNLEVPGLQKDLRSYAWRSETKEQVEKWLTEDIRTAYENLERKFGQEKWFKDLSINRKIALTDMSFNLNSRLFKFEETIDLLRAGKFEAAAAEAMDSKWARQVGSRAKRVTAILTTDELPNIETELKAKGLR
jgi:lysozyme